MKRHCGSKSSIQHHSWWFHYNGFFNSIVRNSEHTNAFLSTDLFLLRVIPRMPTFTIFEFSSIVTTSTYIQCTYTICTCMYSVQSLVQTEWIYMYMHKCTYNNCWLMVLIALAHMYMNVHVHFCHSVLWCPLVFFFFFFFFGAMIINYLFELARSLT